MPYLPNRLTRTRGRLYLPATCLADMLTEGWRTFPNETGGILLGTSRGDEVAVTTVIGPGPDATHARYAFTPDSDWQAAEVAAAWHLNPATQYLGDWHTHPGGTTHFSRLDTATAQSIADAPDAQQPEPVMLVLALGVNASSRAAASRLRRERLVPLAMHVTLR